MDTCSLLSFFHLSEHRMNVWILAMLVLAALEMAMSVCHLVTHIGPIRNIFTTIRCISKIFVHISHLHRNERQYRVQVEKYKNAPLTKHGHSIIVWLKFQMKEEVLMID